MTTSIPVRIDFGNCIEFRVSSVFFVALIPLSNKVYFTTNHSVCQGFFKILLCFLKTYGYLRRLKKYIFEYNAIGLSDNVTLKFNVEKTGHVVIEYITLANRFNGGMNSTGFKKVRKQGEFSNSIREYTDFSFDTLLEYYDANNAVIETEIAKTENIPLKQVDIIGSFSKHISEMKDITKEDKEIALSTLLALKNSKNGILYLIKPNDNNNYSYEEFLIANEDEITLVKHIIGDGSNSIKNRERLTPSTLITRLTELEEQKNSDKKRVRNKF